ncbi:GCN5-related N-acetyltransferase OS=Tsukamurella paurometabola (strain ATCC 8368 / DSM / CCUG 35730 / CIP 100753 / JCM 10117 / KCTC 9821 / NBRC 16120 /NCIMB 702349 / NCTC 13040) OX=521096 GN=Tpau_0930 PE=4 SV=1 [Tsukamurella paurometabola]|uniref:GCN5-related N-acetyltransferase n=1 Tax=Tsukamurella paurometabola (strain ATCC 8368 / DSM 20162 / CCUG 35730 / CIP 100753 / JCM 10117 / KCTC 9821 / NBRC 16120 / NCIMB 702349 / NCTC 13040) TaxID=521096 RepID=D5UUJ2_TSUPD|nr:GNAT family protein [Tsukamurella paurometabola]ADG77563.1 GCN5-related N-acetyltransferase [Tsukamurella paurometabola DSM 20162]SUP27728.1 Predicted acetyltransferase [Tsukamurella paurometabola]
MPHGDPAPAVRIAQLDPRAVTALAVGDLRQANRYSEIVLPPSFATPESLRLWRMRDRQIAADPASAEWITGAILDTDRDLVVGRAGYHGPPDGNGTVEIGYAVDPEYRRRGYARAALEFLLARAGSDPSVRTVRATVSPDNTASSSLIAQYGFVEIGTQIDEVDGLELVYEVPSNRAEPPIRATRR